MKKILLFILSALFTLSCVAFAGCGGKDGDGQKPAYNVNDVLSANAEFAEYYNTVASIKAKFENDGAPVSSVSAKAPALRVRRYAQTDRSTIMNKVGDLKTYLCQDNVVAKAGDLANVHVSFTAMMSIAFDMPLYLGQIITKEQNATAFYGKTIAIGLSSDMMQECYYRAEKAENVIQTFSYEPATQTYFYSTVRFVTEDDFDFCFIQKQKDSSDVCVAYVDSAQNYINVVYENSVARIGYSLKGVSDDFSQAYELSGNSVDDSAITAITAFSDYVDEAKIEGLKTVGVQNNGADYAVSDEQYAAVMQEINNIISSEKTAWFVVNGTLVSYCADGTEGDTLTIPEGITAIAYDFQVYVEDGKGIGIKKLVLPSTLTTVKEEKREGNVLKRVKCDEKDFKPKKYIAYTDNCSLKNRDEYYHNNRDGNYYMLFESFEINDTLGKSPFVFDDENKTLVTKDGYAIYICDNESVTDLDLSAYKFYNRPCVMCARKYLHKLKTITLKWDARQDLNQLAFLFDNLDTTPLDIDTITLDLSDIKRPEINVSSITRQQLRSDDNYILYSKIGEIVFITNDNTQCVRDKMGDTARETFNLLANYTNEQLEEMLRSKSYPQGADNFFVMQFAWFRLKGHAYNTVVEKLTVDGTAELDSDIFSE